MERSEEGWKWKEGRRDVKACPFLCAVLKFWMEGRTDGRGRKEGREEGREERSNKGWKDRKK